MRLAKTLLPMAAGLSILLVGSPAWADVVPFPQIDGASRAKMLAALAGLVILGFGMVALAWLGARYVQRYRHSGPLNPTQRPTQSDWDPKPAGKEPTKPGG